MTYRKDIEDLTHAAESHAIATNLAVVESQNAIALAILSLADAVRGVPLEAEDVPHTTDKETFSKDVAKQTAEFFERDRGKP
jgi:hypothetical protein